MRPKISLVIPVLNEAAHLGATLQSLQSLRAQEHELILVDGGSSDSTLAIAVEFSDQLLSCEPGRARQMNRGAQAATGDILWFLHADTLAPSSAAEEIVRVLGEGRTRIWGRFDVRLSGAHPLFRLIESMMNLRSRLSGIATGDQGIFVRREVFEQIGGYGDLPLMEDIELSRRLKRLGRPYCSRVRLLTSSRRWEQNGILCTILRMWYLRLGFFFGRSPERLAEIYRAGGR